MSFLLTIILSIVCTALNAQTFSIFSGTFTWAKAKADAKSRGAQLAVIDSQAKQSAEEGIIGNGEINRRLCNTREYSDRYY